MAAPRITLEFLDVFHLWHALEQHAERPERFARKIHHVARRVLEWELQMITKIAFTFSTDGQIHRDHEPFVVSRIGTCDERGELFFIRQNICLKPEPARSRLRDIFDRCCG